MIGLFGFAMILALVVFHTVVAGVLTRFFRLRLSTTWGWVLYTAILTPIVLLGSTLIFTGVLGIGTGVDLGSPAVALGLFVLLPVVLGSTIDYLYIPPPEEYELPETT